MPLQGVAKQQISEPACHTVAGSVGRSKETLRPDLARQYKGGYMFSKDLLESGKDLTKVRWLASQLGLLSLSSIWKWKNVLRFEHMTV